MKRGTLTGVRHDVTGEWRIQVSDLERVYPIKSTVSPSAERVQPIAPEPSTEARIFAEQLRSAENTIARLEDERNYLRQRLQEGDATIYKLTALLTDQRKPADTGIPIQRIPWRRYTIIIVLELGAIAAGVAAYYWRDSIKDYAKAAVTAQPEPPPPPEQPLEPPPESNE